LRYIHFYALSVTLVLAAGVAVVLGGSTPEPEPPRAAFVAQAVEPIESTTTSLDLVVAEGDGKELVLSSGEIGLTEEAIIRSTTTTSSTTTTTAAPKPKQSTSSGNGSSGSDSASSPTTTAPPQSTVQAGYRSDYESEFRSLINSYRSSNGLSSMSNHGDLASRARWWAKSMAQNGSLAHSNLGSIVPPWATAGENVGTGGSVSSVFGLLKGSSGHAANMLGDFTHMGVGVWVDSSGKIWTAHVFAR